MEKLKLYLKEQNLSPKDFAQSFGFAHKSVYNWLQGHKPNWGNIKKMEEKTDGFIQAVDWF